MRRMSPSIKRQVKSAAFWVNFHANGMLSAMSDGEPNAAAIFARRAAHHARLIQAVGFTRLPL